MVRIFVFVIGSFEEKCYTSFIQMRKQILKKYAIEHYFLYDDNVPEYYTMDSNDIIIPKITNADPNHINPHMILKFLKGLMKIDIDNYDYIIRVNLSTYINFPKLQRFLESQPREGYAAGYNLTHDGGFISGTCMIFSADLAHYLTSIAYENPTLSKYNDDVVLSHLIKEIINGFVHIPMAILHTDTKPTKSEIEEQMIFRIKHRENRNKDIHHWKFLMSKVDNLNL